MAVQSRAVPHRVRRSRLSLAIAGVLAATVGYVASADARIVKFEVTIQGVADVRRLFVRRRRPVRKARRHGLLASSIPNDPKNAVIVDLQLAPRNAKGMVEYSHTFYILKPIDLSKGAHA